MHSFRVRVLPGECFGAPGSAVVVGSIGPQILWAADAATGNRVTVPPAATVPGAVDGHRGVLDELLRPRLPPGPSRCGDTARWISLLGSDAGVAHDAGWVTSERAARALDYSRMDGSHDSESARYFVPAGSVAELAAHLGVRLNADMRFIDNCMY